MSILPFPLIIPVLAASDTTAAGQGLLKLDVGLMMWTWVSFFLVLYVLSRYAYKPMLAMVRQREKRIQETLAKAEDARIRAEAAATERERLLKQAQEDSQKVVDAAREAAEAQGRRILDEAHQDASRILKHAEEEVGRQRRHAMAQLGETVADLAVEAASRILHHELDADAHRALIDSVLRELEHEGG